MNDGKTPDPGTDRIAAVFYAFQKSETESTRRGAIIVNSEYLNNNRIRCIPFEEVSSELEVLNMLVDIVVELDPDVVTGWEVQRGSWGYVNSRAALYGSLFICIFLHDVQWIQVLSFWTSSLELLPGESQTIMTNGALVMLRQSRL